MRSTAGRLLVATPNMGDPNFEQSVIYVLEHNEEGALGVVLNRPSDAPVGEHVPELGSLVVDPDVFFVGGPVSPEMVLGVGLVDGSIEAIDLDGVIEGRVPRPDLLRLFAGYSGWGEGQLEGELAMESWLVVDGIDADVFRHDPERLWRTVLRRQPGPVAGLAFYPDSPILN